jgi:cytochrome c6
MSRAHRVAVLCFMAAGLAAACLWNARAYGQGAGEKVYKAKCASCHGADGAGTTLAGKLTKARDFCSDDVRKETEDEWQSIIVKGKNKMPSYDKKLSESEIKDAIAYVRGLCKK